MDVHLIILIIEGIAALDRKLQKSLTQAIPRLAKLRSDPADALAESPVFIGPKKRHTLSIVIGAIAGLLVVLLLVLVMGQVPQRAKPDATLIIGVIASFVVAVLAVRSIVMRLTLGSEMTLRPEGVQLVHGSRIVFFTWEMFNAGGDVFQPDPKLAVVPINPRVPVAVSKPGGEVHACLIDEMPSQPLVVVSGGAQISFKDRYEVAVGDLARLLREISGKLCGPSEVSEDFSTAPLVVGQGNGWYELPLTQLPFPPLCVGCGETTRNTLKQTVGAHRTHAQIELPLCEDCGRVRSRRIRIGVLIGVAIGISLAVVLALVIAANDRKWQPRKVAILATVFSVMGASAIGAIGGVIGRDTGTPLKWRKFKPENGTVQFKHRWPERAAVFFDALRIDVRPRPEETPADV